MRHKSFLFIVLLILIFLGVFTDYAKSQTWAENFDNASGYSVPLGSEGSDGASDYFMRTDGSDIDITYNGNSGLFFAAQDIDDGGWTGSASPSQILWTGIDISGKSGLEFSGQFASAATGKIDKSDSVLVEYRLDGGNWQKLLAFRNNGSTYNDEFGEDSNFDGIRDGVVLSETMTSFTKNIYDSGNSMDLRITVAVNSGGEDFAFDSFTLSTVSGNQSPEISNINQSPASGITSSDEVEISADIKDDGSIDLAELHWGTSSGNLSNTIPMSLETGNTYSGNNKIPAQGKSTKVFYEIYSEDDEGASTTSSEYNYEVKDVEIPDLIISEVADPADVYEARFVELYNTGAETIDFSETQVYFSRQSNGGNHSSKRLTGKLRPGCTYVVANSSNLESNYDISAGLDFGSVTGNGDDGYFLFVGGDENSGVLFDAYGVPDEDGSGKDWEYTDSKAVRKNSVEDPNDTWTAGEWDIFNADVADMNPAAYRNYTTFQGQSGLAWDMAENWTGGTVPSDSSIVCIPAGKQVTVSSAGQCGELILESGESASASLIGAENLTLSGEAIVEQYLAETSQSYNWHYLAMPVQTSKADVFPGASHDNTTIYASGWDESNDQWNHLTGADALSKLEGYAVPVNSPGKAEFAGDLITGSQTTSTLSYSNGNHFAGFHLVGNPFTASFDAGQLSGTNWTGDIWVRTDGNFREYNVSAGAGTLPDGIIPAMQGFWVRVKSGGGTVTLNPSALTHNASNLYKSRQNKALTLQISRGNYSDEIVLLSNPDAKDGFDEKFDTQKMFADNERYPQIYFIAGQKKLSVNGIKPLNDKKKTIPLGFQTSMPGKFEINALNIGDYDSFVEIHLKDNTTGAITNLRDGSYRFKANAFPQTPGRFSVILSKGTYTDVNETIQKDLKIWNASRKLYIRSEEQGRAEFEVIDITGRVIRDKQISLQCGLVVIPLNEKPGIYFVKLRFKGKNISRKIIVK